MIVCADLNIETLNSNMLMGNYLHMINGNGYIILSEDATRVTHQSSTYIGHIIISKIEKSEFNLLQD